jgi:hypothetical protein
LPRADWGATIDETSSRRGHSYLTLVADADARRVVFVSKGRRADNIAGFVQHLCARNGAADNITAACIDMSPAFIKGVTDHLPKATITFDNILNGPPSPVAPRSVKRRWNSSFHKRLRHWQRLSGNVSTHRVRGR